MSIDEGNIHPLGPNPETIYPRRRYHQLCFLKNAVKNPNIIVGDYTYYDDFRSGRPEDFEKNVLYCIQDKLIIGKFCSIASEAVFLMNGANHRLDLISTYPFGLMGNGWERVGYAPENRGDMIIGNDVWIGFRAMLLPGVHVGDGAVIGAGAVVTGDVEPYAIVAGNPARTIRKRFDETAIESLLEIQWWNWDMGKITRNLRYICGGDVEMLQRCR